MNKYPATGLHEVMYVSSRQFPPPGGAVSLDKPQEITRVPPARIPPAAFPLSPREKEVFHAILRGKDTLEIAAELGISRKTVEAHRLNLRRKLGITFCRLSLRDVIIALGLIRECPHGSQVICTVPPDIECDTICRRYFKEKGE